jgi:hypothetical protein
MRRAPRLSAAMSKVMTLGLLVLTVVSGNSTHQAATVDGAPTLAVAQSSGTLPITSAETAYFEVGFPPEDLTFTIMLTDTARIQEARDIVNGVQTEKIRVMGTIIKAPAFYNPHWSYHLDPASIEFFEVAVEVCDAHPQYVEEHLEEVCGSFLPKCVWCPCSSVVTAEVHISRQFFPIVVK